MMNESCCVVSIAHENEPSNLHYPTGRSWRFGGNFALVLRCRAVVLLPCLDHLLKLILRNAMNEGGEGCYICY